VTVAAVTVTGCDNGRLCQLQAVTVTGCDSSRL